MVLLVDLDELFLDAVADGSTSHNTLKFEAIRTNDQEGGVKLEAVALDQSAVVLLLHEGQRLGQAQVVFEEVVDELLRFDAWAALLFCEEHGVSPRSRHSRLA